MSLKLMTITMLNRSAPTPLLRFMWTQICVERGWQRLPRKMKKRMAREYGIALRQNLNKSNKAQYDSK
jgi:hypothetical protein